MEEMISQSLGSQHDPPDDDDIIQRRRRYRRRRRRGGFSLQRIRTPSRRGGFSLPFRVQIRTPVLDGAKSAVDRTKTLTVLLLLETSEDCNRVKSIFELASELHGQLVSVVSFTSVQDALNYMHLDFTLTTDKHSVVFEGWIAENRVEPITNLISFGPERLPPIPPLPMVLIVDELHRFHSDFNNLMDVFKHLKLVVLTADQSLAIREMDLLNPPRFEVHPVERPFSSRRWRRGMPVSVADDVHALLHDLLQEFILDISDLVRRGAVDIAVV